jgi:hypothetical protein
MRALMRSRSGTGRGRASRAYVGRWSFSHLGPACKRFSSQRCLRATGGNCRHGRKQAPRGGEPLRAPTKACVFRPDPSSVINPRQPARGSRASGIPMTPAATPSAAPAVVTRPARGAVRPSQPKREPVPRHASERAPSRLPDTSVTIVLSPCGSMVRAERGPAAGTDDRCRRSWVSRCSARGVWMVDRLRALRCLRG